MNVCDQNASKPLQSPFGGSVRETGAALQRTAQRRQMHKSQMGVARTGAPKMEIACYWDCKN